MTHEDDQQGEDENSQNVPFAKLNSKQRLAIEALMRGQTFDQAAATAHIGRNTLWRWRMTPEFQEACRQAQAFAFRSAAHKLQTMSDLAADRLLALMENENASVSLHATKALLALGFKARETTQLETEIEQLKAQVEEIKETYRDLN